MTRKMTLSLVLTASVLLSLVSFPSPVLGQKPQRFTADTGIIIANTEGDMHVRITVTPTGKTPVTIRFRQMRYKQDTCISNQICKLSVASDWNSDLMTLAPDEAVSFDLLATTYGRGIVMSNSQDARV